MAQVYQPILPKHVYLIAIGQLVACASENMILQIEKLADIAQEESILNWNFARIMEAFRAGQLRDFGIQELWTS
eukprot:jgi/Hompol1/1752/HPOL_000008-RA